MSDLPDVNVLVAWAVSGHDSHDKVVRWSEQMGNFCTTPVTEMGLVRLLMNPAISGVHMEFSAACDVLRSIRDFPRWTFLSDDLSFADSSIGFVAPRGYRQVTDAHLVGMALRHHVRLVTLDTRIAVGFGLDRTDLIHTL